MNIIEVISEEYNNILTEYKKLGEGGYGKVFEKDGYAYKVTTDDDEAMFALKIMNNQDKLTSFPKIYYVKKTSDDKYNIIKRELIKILGSTETAYVKSNDYKISTFVNFGNEESLEFIKKTKFSDKFIQFLINLRNDYLLLGKKNYSLDIHSGNIGLTFKGDFVLFDF